jgi:deazaflavin-dependent oxidoreductase (nitroreductase family)
MPHDVTLKAMNIVHRLILSVTRGRRGWTTAGMPVLQLTTVGRKSGVARSVMLTSPVQFGDSLVVVASRGGDDHHPAWYTNLVANPVVEVVRNGNQKVAMRARTATSVERTELWPQITSAYNGYASYQAKTTREIPVVVLDPIGQK